ncbi:MAG TPA: DNA repair protein RecN [Fimbriimonadaceae bacterium]|nr:DNA repair protein RecN [Fimbriimonadaceae bacterium]
MLLELTVENLAIIERAQLILGPGFTALTGETGAGKSLLVDAIGLALGGRAETELVRTGAARGSVSLVADLSTAPEIRDRCEELGYPLDEAQLYIHREVSAEGRSTCRINGRQAPVGTLRQIGGLLVDLHGQHDHQSLLDPLTHGEHLDLWIGEEAVAWRLRVAAAFAECEHTRRALASVRTDRREREHRLDLLRHQIGEIEGAGLTLGETEDVTSRLRRLQHAERLAQAALNARAHLFEEEGAADERVGQATRDLEAACRLDPELEPSLRLLRDAQAALGEASRTLGRYLDSLEVAPGAVEEAAARLDVLQRLHRKYGETDEAVVAFLESARRDLSLLEGLDEDEETLATRLSEQEADLEAAAGSLTALRTSHSQRFASLVETQIRDLAMDRATFVTQIEPKPIDAQGGDRVEFLFSANAGEPPKPLAKIASGGEISRVMLALKVGLAGRAGVPTLIFDEVDAGLGGRAAATVARKLDELSRHNQVIVISHLPQIAGRATTHFRIDKVERSGRSVTEIRALNSDERVEEIARMLAGEHVTEPALANARALLQPGLF